MYIYIYLYLFFCTLTLYIDTNITDDQGHHLGQFITDGEDLLKWIGFQTSVEDVQAMVRRGEFPGGFSWELRC